MKQPQLKKGFTLIEILLVLVLLSLTAVAVITTLPSSSNDEAKKQAQSFFHRLQLLNEEAVLSGKDFGLLVDEVKAKYSLLMLTDSGWEAAEIAKIPSETALQDGVALQLELGGGAWAEDDRLFEPGSLFDEDMFADLEEEKKPKPPQVFLFSSAEITPFTLAFYPQNGDSFNDGWRVLGKETGQLVLLAPGEEDEESDSLF